MHLRVLAAGDCSIAASFLSPVTGGGASIERFSSSAEVQAQVGALPPDLILIDADCEDPRGLALCRELKEHPATMLLPVIAVGRSSRRKLEAFTAGADDFFTRQIPRQLFQARAEALVRSSAARRRLADAQLTAEVQRREQLRNTFRRYLSPRLADKILSDSELRETLMVSPETRMRAVVMFADMRGFTRISERLGPHEIVPLLNEYFSLLTEITFQHDGTVFHMAGDCLMVGFGVPLDQPDSPQRAIKTAQEMLGQFGTMAESWRARHEIDTGLGIGINEGDVIVGNVGSAAYMNYTIIGDTVNIASRLSQRARAGEMLFSRTVKQSLDERGFDIGAMPLPPMMLRGRTTPIDIYCVPLEKRLDLAENREVA